MAPRSLAICALLPLLAQAQDMQPVGQFSLQEPDRALQGWESLQFEKVPRHTQYRLQRIDDRVALCAESEASASGLIKPVQFDLREFPWVSWSWRVENLYQGSNVRSKAGDDYPVRLYITFQTIPDQLGLFERVQFEAARLVYGDYPPIAALNYIWATQEPVGLMVDNAYTARAKMIVVESGPKHLQQWRSYRRNLLEDYRQAFGGEPPPLAGVAVMTDSDNTGETGRACYGDILFSKTKPADEESADLEDRGESEEGGQN